MTGVLFEITNEVARLTIDRADKGNAITLAALQAMDAHLDDALSARALVVTGAGERVFSAGMDLSDVADPGAWADNPLTAFCDKLQRLPIPTVARINGAVIGGAVEIALSCDFRIAAEGTKLRVPAAAIGIHYEHEGLTRAVAQLGTQAARRIYMLGEAFDSKGMAAMGFLDDLAPAGGLDEAVDGLLARIRASAPLAANGMKQSIVEIMGGGDAAAAKTRIRAAWASADLQEGLAAVREKRPPKFMGT